VLFVKVLDNSRMLSILFRNKFGMFHCLIAGPIIRLIFVSDLEVIYNRLNLSLWLEVERGSKMDGFKI